MSSSVIEKNVMECLRTWKNAMHMPRENRKPIFPIGKGFTIYEVVKKVPCFAYWFSFYLPNNVFRVQDCNFMTSDSDKYYLHIYINN